MNNNKENEINWRNWRDEFEGEEKVFEDFTEKITQRWIQEGFTKEQTKEWIKEAGRGRDSKIKWSCYAHFLQNIENLTPQQNHEIGEEKVKKLKENDYKNWIGQFSICNHCQKRVIKEKIHFSNRLRDLDFCSPKCQEQAQTYGQEWLNRWYPKNSVCLIWKERYTTRWINNYEKTRTQITKLNICDQGLFGSLDLSDFVNLTELTCSDNQLTSLNLGQNNKLETLVIENNNFPEENPIWLNNFVNLKKLNLGKNKLIGSLGFIKNMNDLEEINIQETNLISDLNHLPLSLKKLNYNDIELEIYIHNLVKIAYPELLKKNDKKIEILDYSKARPRKFISIPEFLQEELSKNITFPENHNSHPNYSYFLIRDKRHFIWEDKNKLPEPSIFPTKLYNIRDNKVIITEYKPDIKNYVILSYVWGNLSDRDNLTTWDYTYKDKYGNINAKEMGVNEKFGTIGTTRQSTKSLKKAIEVCKLIGVDYLWMDQLCIDQFDHEENNKEVPKMRQYYSNAAATLVAIDAEIGELTEDNEVEIIKKIMSKIITSSWFKRSWTFQEGLLSKQTIFMFDDYLVDGRVLTMTWVGLQKKNSNLNRNSWIFITPLGWSYGAPLDNNKSIALTLGEALLAVKHRNQTVPVDGIYSILGILPYGKKIKTNYRHFGHVYSQSELEEVISEIIKEIINQGHGKEILSWTNFSDNIKVKKPWEFSSSGIKFKSWPPIPLISQNGSIKIEGLLLDNSDKFNYTMLERIGKITNQGIQILAGNIKTNEENDKIVVVDNKIDEIKSWVSKIQFIFSNKTDFMILKESNPYTQIKENNLTATHDEENFQELFIDMVNKEIITKRDNPARYQELIEDNFQLTR